MTIEIQEVPENKGTQENFEKIAKIANEKNEKIAKLFGMEPSKDVKAIFYHSSGALSGKIFSQEREFKGYLDGTNEVNIIHPEAVDGLFTDLWPEMEIITEYVFVKYYLCKKYYPNKEDFKLYYKYVSDALADIVSGKFQDKVAKFEYKMYFPGKKLKKDIEVALLLYFMKEHSGIEYIFKYLDKIMEDCDIQKTIKDIYNKSLDELLLPLKEKTIQEERKLQELEKEKRRAAYNANQKNFNTRNAQRNNTNEYTKKFVTRDRYKANNNKFQDAGRPKSKFGYSKPKPVSQTQQKPKEEYVAKPKIN
jgi:hypothetical protein